MAAKLNKKIKDLAEVDEKFHDLYTKEGEEFVLSGIEIEDPNKKDINEFRNKNRQLHNEVETLKKDIGFLHQLKELDPELSPEKLQKALKAQAELEKMEGEKLLKEGDIEAVFSKRLEPLRSDYERRLNLKDEQFRKAVEEREKVQKKLGAHLINAEVQKAILKVGTPRKGALTDILSRASEVWQLDDTGTVLPKRHGETIYSKGGDVLSMEEWAAGLMEDASFLFEPSQGGGATGGSERGQDGVKWIDNDPLLIGKYQEQILAGTVKVRM